MRAWTFNEFGVENLSLGQAETPVPGPRQVLLKMRAVSLNYRDLLMVRGHYDPRVRRPLVPCSDGVGEVVAVGDDVTRFRIGDRAIPIFSQSWITGPPTSEALNGTLGGPLDGTLQELLVVDEQGAVVAPAHLSDAECATLPCAAVTAWRALVTEGRTKAGDWVLTQGTGGVSLFAVQIGNALGARVICTSSSDEKLARVNALGSVAGINYRTDPKWGKTALAMSGGCDLVVELGGAKTLNDSLRAVKFGGTVAMIGVLSGTRAEIDVTKILMRGVRVQGIFVGNRTDLEDVIRCLDAHQQVRPVVDRVFAFNEAPAAFEHLASASHFGKVVVGL